MNTLIGLEGPREASSLYLICQDKGVLGKVSCEAQEKLLETAPSWGYVPGSVLQESLDSHEVDCEEC